MPDTIHNDCIIQLNTTYVTDILEWSQYRPPMPIDQYYIECSSSCQNHDKFYMMGHKVDIIHPDHQYSTHLRTYRSSHKKSTINS